MQPEEPGDVQGELNDPLRAFCRALTGTYTCRSCQGQAKNPPKAWRTQCLVLTHSPQPEEKMAGPWVEGSERLYLSPGGNQPLTKS